MHEIIFLYYSARKPKNQQKTQKNEGQQHLLFYDKFLFSGVYAHRRSDFCLPPSGREGDRLRWKEPGVYKRICLMICFRTILDLQTDKTDQKSVITHSPPVTQKRATPPPGMGLADSLHKRNFSSKQEFIFRKADAAPVIGKGFSVGVRFDWFQHSFLKFKILFISALRHRAGKPPTPHYASQNVGGAGAY